MSTTPSEDELEREDYKLVIFGWITTVLGVPKDADPTEYNELTDRLYDLFAAHTQAPKPVASEDELAYKLARLIARASSKWAWSKMTKGEKNDEIQFIQQQQDYKDILAHTQAQTERASDGELQLCNCDGFWHVEVNGTTHYISDSSIKAVTERAVIEAKLASAKRLQNQITRYGDGEISYHLGEATVPISKVLDELTPHYKSQLTNNKIKEADNE